MMDLNLIFMGTPAFSATTLQALVEAGYKVVAVYSQPPRPSGRGHHISRSPVHQYAESVGIPVYTPTSLKTDEAQNIFDAHKADLAIVAAYGLLLPTEILESPRLGCVNVHASLLPRWRGAAPIQRAIMAGDKGTGITIMQMDKGLDTGDMLLSGQVDITQDTTAPMLHDQLAKLGAKLTLEVIPRLAQGSIIPISQPLDGITYAHKLTKAESQLDWRQSAQDLHQKIRALYPWPGVYFIHDQTILKIAQAEIVSVSGQPGEVKDELVIVCGRDGLKITLLQKPGGKWMPADDFLRGYPINSGTILPCPAIN